MAFNSLIRRSSASILKRAVDGAISPVLNVENRSRGYIAGSQFPTATDQNLIRQIAAYADRPKPTNDQVEAIPLPEGFAFEIVNHSISLCLKRTFQDEIIEVSVPLDEVTDDTPSFLMSGRIGKSRHQYMKFWMTVKPGSIVYKKLSMRDYYNGHMEQFKQFLAIRGINPCTMKFLFDYCRTRGTSPMSLSVSKESLGTVSGFKVEGIGDGFPFEITDVDYDELTLRRKYEDEIIEVRVLVLKAKYGDDIQGLLMDVDIYCGDEYPNPSVTFGLVAFPDNSHQIAISSMSVREGYTGFQEAFQMFFEKRGIKLSTTNFLFDYIRNLNDKLNATKCFQGIGVGRIRQHAHPL